MVEGEAGALAQTGVVEEAVDTLGIGWQLPLPVLRTRPVSATANASGTEEAHFGIRLLAPG